MARSPSYSSEAYPPMTATCTTKLELRIRCRNLVDRDILSKSDPMVVLYNKPKGSRDNRWIEIGRTENIKNCLDPDFSKALPIDYRFEEVQNLRFEVYDIDNVTPSLADDDFLGSCECTLGQIVSENPMTRPLLWKNNTRAGLSIITVTAEELSESSHIMLVKFCGRGLDKKDFFGKSDPYIEIFKKAGNAGYQLMHRTEYISYNLNPNWKPFELVESKLTTGNRTKELKFICYDYNNNGSPDLIGQAFTTVDELLKGSPLQWPLINEKKKLKKGSSYNHSGMLILESCKVTMQHSFLEFIHGGLQMNFSVAIDFTGSNGNPRDPKSLHYIHPSQPNEYMHAIMAVGNVIQDYDSDKMFPVLGFGAQVPPRMTVSHEFAVNFNPQNPYVAGVQGILDAYRNCLPQIKLYGPTNFSEVIYHVSKFAEQARGDTTATNYFVLLIITDGLISDLHETLRAIVHSSYQPMSIIIVGVGNEDFATMVILDGDDGVLKDPEGRKAVRDIVQFVPFNRYRHGPQEQLAAEVLAEVPRQVVDHYRQRGIAPGVPKPLNMEEVVLRFAQNGGENKPPPSNIPPPGVSQPSPYQSGVPGAPPNYPSGVPGAPNASPYQSGVPNAASPYQSGIPSTGSQFPQPGVAPGFQNSPYQSGVPGGYPSGVPGFQVQPPPYNSGVPVSAAFQQSGTSYTTSPYHSGVPPAHSPYHSAPPGNYPAPDYPGAPGQQGQSPYFSGVPNSYPYGNTTPGYPSGAPNIPGQPGGPPNNNYAYPGSNFGGSTKPSAPPP